MESAIALGLLATERAQADRLAIVLTGVGVVGAMYASGPPQVEDHEFIVACLHALKARV